MSKLKISAPRLLTRTGHATPLAKADSKLPTHEEWTKLTNGGRSSQPALNQIYEYLYWWHRETDNVRRVVVLGQLFFNADHWLKLASRAPHDDAYRFRKPVVESLYVSVVEKLCVAFDCGVNVLPQALEEYWGRVLVGEKAKMDAGKDVAVYLTRAEVEKYRLRFDGGKAEMLDRSTKVKDHDIPVNPKFVPAESSVIGWTDARGTQHQMMSPGYAGFALSMAREFYMAHHRGSFYFDNFFHSSYLSGGTVLCTGTIKIQKGQVVGLANDSGHYRPTIEHLLNAVLALKMHGCDVSKIWVSAVPESWRERDGKVGKTWLQMWGHELIAQRGGSSSFKFMSESNAQQIKDRGGCNMARLRTLPPPPVHA